MPIEYKIDKERRLVFTTAKGVLTPDEMWKHQKDLLKDPEFVPTFSQLSDFTQVTKMELTPHDVQQFAQAKLFDPDAHRAIVVKDALSFGLAKMFETLRADKDERGIAIFRDAQEGLN